VLGLTTAAAASGAVTVPHRQSGDII